MRGFKYKIFLVFLTAALSAPFSVTAQNEQSRPIAKTLRPSRPLPEGVKTLKNIEYVPGGGASRSLDLYLPEKAEHPLPLIIWIHGGAWKGGDKNTPLGIRFISRGYALASINYRLSGEAKFPAQINDCRAAVRYLRAHAREWGIHPDYIAVWGGSAGGHLVSLLGTTADIKNFDGKDSGPASVSPRVQAVVDWYGPSDAQMPGMFNSSVFKDLIGGSPEEYKEKALLASPILYVSSNSAPFLIMHGEQDHTVSIQHSVRLYEALKKAGVEATYKPIPGAGHGGKEFTKTENLKVIMDFFDRHLMRPILRQMKKQ